MKDREVILAVCGGIAAYKSAQIVSSLAQLGAGVTVVMTADAQMFVTPLTFQALSARSQQVISKAPPTISSSNSETHAGSLQLDLSVTRDSVHSHGRIC